MQNKYRAKFKYKDQKLHNIQQDTSHNHCFATSHQLNKVAHQVIFRWLCMHTRTGVGRTLMFLLLACGRVILWETVVVVDALVVIVTGQESTCHAHSFSPARISSGRHCKITERLLQDSGRVRQTESKKGWWLCNQGPVEKRKYVNKLRTQTSSRPEATKASLYLQAYTQKVVTSQPE